MARRAIEISATQLVAATAATVTATVAASFMGVYGTIIGAAVMSVVTTSGTAIYQHYLERTRERVRNARTLAERGRPGKGGAGATDLAGETGSSEAAAGTTAEEGADAGSGGDPANETAVVPEPGDAQHAGHRGLRITHWYVLAGVTAFVFVVTISIIVIIGALTGDPLGLGGQQPDGKPSVVHTTDSDPDTSMGTSDPTAPPTGEDTDAPASSRPSETVTITTETTTAPTGTSGPEPTASDGPGEEQAPQQDGDEGATQGAGEAAPRPGP